MSMYMTFNEEDLIEHVFETIGLSHMLHLLANECKERAEYLERTKGEGPDDDNSIKRYSGLAFSISAVAYAIEGVADLAEKGEA